MLETAATWSGLVAAAAMAAVALVVNPKVATERAFVGMKAESDQLSIPVEFAWTWVRMRARVRRKSADSRAASTSARYPHTRWGTRL